MKLVTFDAGRMGRLEGEGGDGVVELECASTREWFECGGQTRETGERFPLAQVRLRAPIVPKKFFHPAGNFAGHHEELRAVDWSHPVHKGIVFFQIPHPVELHQHNDVIAGMHGRLASLRDDSQP